MTQIFNKKCQRLRKHTNQTRQHTHQNKPKRNKNMTFVATWSVADHDFVTAMQSYFHSEFMSYRVNVRFMPYRVHVTLLGWVSKIVGCIKYEKITSQLCYVTQSIRSCLRF